MKHVNRVRSWVGVLACAISAVTAVTSTQAGANADASVSDSAGGMAKVSFVHPERFVDARDGWGTSEDKLKVLEQHLQRLAKRYLAEGQVLQVEVLDVDLAGRVRPFRAGAELRVVRDIDWPRIKLSYVLEANGAVLQRGEETLTDINFMSRLVAGLATEPLRYEKRMLSQWFTSRFVSHTAPDH